MTECRPQPAGWKCGWNGAHVGDCRPRRIIEVGEVAQLHPQKLWWLARATSLDGRYVLLTTMEEQRQEECSECKQYDVSRIAVVYTLVDHREQVRGAINVIGGGCDIQSVCGPDENVAEAMRMVLEDGFEVSHRNRVRLKILTVRPAC